VKPQEYQNQAEKTDITPKRGQFQPFGVIESFPSSSMDFPGISGLHIQQEGG